MALLVAAPTASADLDVCVFGAGADQCDAPRGVAVDRSNGTVYVADSGNRRIDVFDSAGNFIRAFGWGVADGTTAALQVCTTTCFKGIAGAGAGQLASPAAIAVDDDPASPAFHDVYVFDGSNRIQRFGPT